MAISTLYPVSPAWALLLHDLDIPARRVLERALMPVDLFERDQPMVRADEFCRMMWALEAEGDDTTLALRLADALSFEAFDPPVFAAMCSPDLNHALARVSRYKRTCGPLSMNVRVQPQSTRLVVDWSEPPLEPPPLLLALELAYYVKLARLGTRTHVRPLKATCPVSLARPGAIARYLGVEVAYAPQTTLVFSRSDAEAPFLTAKAGMWRFFEPELRRRLAQLDDSASTKELVRAALREMLPGGRYGLGNVASRLGLSTRTLQRRLQAERTDFRTVLNDTREELARFYVRTSSMAGAEISFLLGFREPSSFLRAFRQWTGMTPVQYRMAIRGTDVEVGAIP